jgi:hypothetical protein
MAQMVNFERVSAKVTEVQDHGYVLNENTRNGQSRIGLFDLAELVFPAAVDYSP